MKKRSDEANQEHQNEEQCACEQGGCGCDCDCASEADAQPDAPDAQEQLRQLDDQYKRVLAEYDNFRKRSQKEREGLFGDITGMTITAFLPVLDNLERACAQPEVDAGVQMIYKQFCDILEKYNVTPCGAVGESFDPNLHNAVMHIEDPELGDNVIAEVLQKGYEMQGRLLRAAMVKTAN